MLEKKRKYIREMERSTNTKILKHFCNNGPKQYFSKLNFSLKYIFNIPRVLET